MSKPLYRDPTFDEVQRMEIRERKCGVCDHRGLVILERQTCSKEKTWPKHGRCRWFQLDERVGDERIDA